MCPTSVIRHQKERRSKCSLTALEKREDITFYKAKQNWSFDVTGFTVLALGAPELSVADAERPLLLLDSTWRLLPQLQTCLYGCAVSRTLPAVDTAYPRVSKLTKDPLGGLASIEALYLAKLVLGEQDDSLLESYYWREEFKDNLRARHLLD